MIRELLNMSKRGGVGAQHVVPLPLVRLRRLRKIVLYLAGGFFFVVAASILWPLPDAFVHPPVQEPVRVLDRNGAPLYAVRTASSGERDTLTYNQIPPTFVSAVLSTEDRKFWSHHGVDLLGIVRAAVQNASAGRIVSGASTVTQQLVSIRQGVTRRNAWRKLLQARDAIRLELVLPKEEILAAYLNTAYFGHQAYGAQAAARTYFGKNLSELSLPEQALLAGLLQSPSAYDSFKSMEKAQKRQLAVLTAMAETGAITQEQADEAAAEPIVLGKDRIEIEAPHFVFWLKDTRPELFVPGSSITTTIDLPLQQEAERIARFSLGKLTEKNVNSAAIVVLDAHTGDLLAMVGSPDYFDDAHDGAVNVAVASRQPGSALKPFTYALALAGGDTLATTVADIEERFFTEDGNPYTPRNYDYEEHGLVRYREALANSYNIAVVKIVQKVGVDRLLRFLQAAGLTTLTQGPDHYGLALTLGDAEVTLLELARAYGIFARGGFTLPLRTTVGDPTPTGDQIIDARIAWLISSVLSDDDARIPEFGVGGPLSLPFPAGVKTGTSRNGRDNWTIGFTPDRIVGVWVGNPDNSPMRDISGVTGAAPIMHDVLTAAMRSLPQDPFRRPHDIVQREICRLSGKLPTPACRERTSEWFIAGTEPIAADDLWKMISIDKRNGLVAGTSCPQNVKTEKTFAVFPADLRSWAHENSWPDPPTRPSPLCPPDASGSSSSLNGLAITWPHSGDAFEMDPLVPDADETITLRAQADSGVERVEWSVNGTVIGEGTAPEYAVRWGLKTGSWTITAKTEETEHSIRITVGKRAL